MESVINLGVLFGVQQTSRFCGLDKQTNCVDDGEERGHRAIVTIESFVSFDPELGSMLTWKTEDRNISAITIFRGRQNFSSK